MRYSDLITEASIVQTSTKMNDVDIILKLNDLLSDCLKLAQQYFVDHDIDPNFILAKKGVNVPVDGSTQNFYRFLSFDNSVTKFMDRLYGQFVFLLDTYVDQVGEDMTEINGTKHKFIISKVSSAGVNGFGYRVASLTD